MLPKRAFCNIHDLLKNQIIDEIIIEKVGGAHRNREDSIKNCNKALEKYLNEFTLMKSNIKTIPILKGFPGFFQTNSNQVSPTNKMQAK